MMLCQLACMSCRCGAHLYGLHLWQSHEHYEYLQKLQMDSSWLSSTDMMLGRLEIRCAAQLSGQKHLPVRDCLVPSLEAVIQGLQTNDTGFLAMRALRIAHDGVCHPGFIFGDNTHWRCICMSRRDPTA